MKIGTLLFFVAIAALGAAHADGPELKAVQHPMSELHAVAKFTIPGSPDWVAIGDSVWISGQFAASAVNVPAAAAVEAATASA